MKPVIDLGSAKVFHGSNLDVLPTLADNSIDAIVTDPPYELGFMGKKWDSSGIAYSVELWQECLRVLKPGGHLLSFGGTRTWHRVAVAIEDAGFEVRDSMAWLYGSGFPKSLDISKAIDKAAGAEREVLSSTFRGMNAGKKSGILGETVPRTDVVTAPATPGAEKWAGWGTALKPAFEPIVVARKPLIGTVAENVLTHGTGGLTIDGSRIGRAEGDNSSAGNRTATFGTQDTQTGGDGSGGWEQNSGGRWPANILLDDYTAGLLDEQSGVLTSGAVKPYTMKPVTNVDFNKGMEGKTKTWTGETNSGGASRFFYIAKASKRDRNEGLEGLATTEAAEMVDREADSAGMNSPRAGAGRTSGAKNFHPTVKPTSLMRYLIKLVTPPNGVVLDPFTGSGSTGKAAILEGFQFVGIELTDEYLPIIEGRLTHALETVAEQELKEETDKSEVLF